MTRLLSLLPLIAACAAGPRPTPAPVGNTNTAPVRYSLQPLRVHGGEGMHSMSQSWTTFAGTLEISAGRATLALQLAMSRSFIHCPEEGPGNEGGQGMQACAPADRKDTSTTATLELTGSARSANGTLTIKVSKPRIEVTLTCTEQGPSLDCAIDDNHTLFGNMGQQPERVTFQRS